MKNIAILINGWIMKTKSIRINAIFKIALNILNIIIPLVVSPYIIAILKRESYDLYTNANAQMQLFMTLGSFGIFSYGVREISKVHNEKEKVKSIFSSLFIIGFVTNIFFTLAYLIFAFFFSKDSSELHLYMILTIQLMGNIINVEWMNEAHENFKFITIKTLIIRLLYVLLVFLLIKGNDDILIYTILLSGTYTVGNIISFVYVIKKTKIKFRKLEIKKHIKSVLLVFLISNIAILYSQTDKIMLGLLHSNASVTRYNLANYIMMSLYNLVISFVVVTIPRLTKFIKDKKIDEYEKLYNKAIQVFLLFMIPITIGVVAISEELIIVYGSGKYNDVISSLTLFAITIFVSSFSYLQGEGVIYISNKENKLVKINLLGGIINISFNFILVFLKMFNANMAIITLLFSNLVVVIIERIYIKRNLKYNLQYFSKKTFLYLIFALTFFPIHMLISIFNVGSFINLLLTMLFSTIVYFGLLIIIKEEEALNLIKIIKRIFNKFLKLLKLKKE